MPHSALKLSLTILNIVALCLSFQTVTRRNFGAMYTFGFVLFFGACFISYSLYRIWQRVKSYFTLKVNLVLLLLFIIAVRQFYVHEVLTSCRNWNKGLSQDLLISPELCEIPQPEVCFVELVDRWQDFSSYLRAV